MDYGVNNANVEAVGNAGSGAAAGVGVVLILLAIAATIFLFVAMWRVFVKAGKPGWAVLIPIYNSYVMIKIAGKPGWWLALYFIPLVNFIVSIIVLHNLAKAFGKGVDYTLLLIFLPIIGWPLLAWGDAQYKKPKTA